MSLIVNRLIGFGARRAASSTPAFINPAGHTKIGTQTSGGGLAAIFDGNTNQDHVSGGYGGSPAWAGLQYASGSKTITQFEYWGPNNYDPGGFGTSCTMDLYLDGSNDGSSWTTLYSLTGFTAGVSEYRNITSGITTSAAYSRHRVRISTGGSNFTAEVKLYGY